jgi:LPXTG-site transpeptidase (sortase) family protein
VHDLTAGEGGPLPAPQRSWAWLLLSVSASVLVTIPLWWPADPKGEDFGRPPWPEPASSTLPEPTGPAVALPVEPASIEVHSARPADLEPLFRGPRPRRLVIPRLGVAAPVDPMGIRPGGAMEIPDDVRTVGWYRFGPSPGGPGSAVLVGHVDSRVAGPGVFFRLSTLRQGDEVRVQLAGGRWRAFEVVSRRLVPKDDIPAGAFVRHGRPILTLITCGGGFDPAVGAYTHNVVVAAVPRS